MWRAFDGFEHAGFTAVNIGRISRHIHDGADHFLDVSIADVGLGGHGHMAIDAVATVLDLVEQVAAVLGVVRIAQGHFHVAWAYGFGIGLMAGEAVVCLNELHSGQQ